MARPRKSSTNASNGPIAIAPKPMSPTIPASQIPSALRFPLLVLLNMSLSSLLYSLTSEFTAGDLAAISNERQSWWDVSATLGWRCAQLGFPWMLGYDAWDVSMLFVLAYTPAWSLLTTFYLIRPASTALPNLAIDVLAIYLPFRLLRTLSPAHTPHPPKHAISNRSIITDIPTTVGTTLLATFIYALTLYIAYNSFLPVFLVTHFDGLRDLSATHVGASAWPSLILSFLPAGFAAREFLFVSSTSSSRTPAAATAPDVGFDPAVATLSETLYYNFWGWYSRREKVLMTRTVILVAMMAASTVARLFWEIKGVELEGAAGWSGLWAVASVTVAAAYWWVGAVEGV